MKGQNGKTVTGAIFWALSESPIAEIFFPLKAQLIDETLMTVAGLLLPIGIWHQIKKSGLAANGATLDVVRKKVK